MNIAKFVYLIPFFVYPTIATERPVELLKCAGQVFGEKHYMEDEVAKFFEANPKNSEGIVECFNMAIELHEHTVVKKILDMIDKKDEVKSALKAYISGADSIINYKYGDSFPLHRALRLPFLIIPKMLLNHSADVNVQDDFGTTPLIMAVKKEEVKIVKCLLDKNAYVNLQDKDGNTALIKTTDNCNEEIADLLLNKGADVRIRNKQGSTALDLALRKLNCKSIAKKLIAEGSDVNTLDDNGMTHLHLACKLGSLELVDCLIHKGVDVTKTYNKKRTALHATCESRSYHICLMKLLLNKGIDPNTKDDEGMTALNLAFKNGLFGQQKFLIDYTTLEKSQKSELLKDMIRRNQFESAQLLIDYGAELETTHFQTDSKFELDFLTKNSRTFFALDRETQLGILGGIKYYGSYNENTMVRELAGTSQLCSNTLLKGWKQKFEKENKDFLSAVFEKADEFFTELGDNRTLTRSVTNDLGARIAKTIKDKYTKIEASSIGQIYDDVNQKQHAFATIVWDEVTKTDKYDDSEAEIVFLAIFAKVFLNVKGAKVISSLV